MVSILLIMILLHIIDDFVLQTICLSKLKQKKWWISEYNKLSLSFEKYKYDYLMALSIHSLSWSIFINLPIMICCTVSDFNLIISVLLNSIVHFIIDDLKANKGQINLVHDQFIHLLQIIITFIIFIK